MNYHTLLYHHTKPAIFWHHQYQKKIHELKTKIDEDNTLIYWEKAKKYTNPFELVYSPYHSLQNDIILKKKVLSRAYYKFYEIMCIHGLYSAFKKNINTFHIAEGPGGFIQAWNDIRKKLDYNDTIYGITLKENRQKHIRGWELGKKYFKENGNISVDYGKDGTGDLFNPINIKYIQDKFKTNKADLITADGGFDFSNDFSSQESNSFPLLFIQSYLAIFSQAQNGIFLIKVFDIFETSTIQLLEMISQLYHNFFVIKPNTSRPANSEKYILFIGFKGLDRNHNIIWTNLLKQLLAWYKQKPRSNIHRIHMGPINNSFCNNLHIQLLPYIMDQIENFRSTHSIINLMKEKTKNPSNISIQQTLDMELDKLRALQLQKATEWIHNFHTYLI